MLRFARIGAALAVAVGMLELRATYAAADGYYDAAWAGGGRIVFAGDPEHSNYGSSMVSALAESNGNLLVGGLLFSPIVTWWLGELTPAGTLNSSFGIPVFNPVPYSGRVNACKIGLPCSGDSYGLSAFARQTDSKVLALSAKHLARTNSAANALDIAAVSGGTGTVSPVFPVDNGTAYVFGVALAVQSDGKILAAGNGRASDSVGAPLEFGLVRLSDDLSVDKTFHNLGGSWGTLVRVDADDSEEYVVSLLPQADGRIVMLGFGTKNGVRYLDLVRLTPDGTPDPQFGIGGNGAAELSLGSPFFPKGTVDRAGRIVVAISPNDGSAVIVARVGANGQLDGTFGNGGLFSLTAGQLACSIVGATDVAIDSAGRIVAVGHCDNQFLVVRIRGDSGALDLSFGFEGVSHGIFAPTSTSDAASKVVFDVGGRLLVAGSSGSNSLQQAGVARLTYDLVYTNNFESAPRGCLLPDCN